MQEKEKKTRETFVVPLGQTDIGTRPYEPTPMGVEPALNKRDIPEDTTYFGPFGQWKKDNWPQGDDAPSIYKEPLGQKAGSPDQQLIPQLYLPMVNLPELECPCPAKFLQEAESKVKLARYKYTSHDDDDLCKNFHGKIFNLTKETGRPVIPSERLGYTTQHPNCQCIWEDIDPILYDDIDVSSLSHDDREHIKSINRLIGQKARHGTLHKIHADGSVYKTTTDQNPRLREIGIAALQETVSKLRKEFDWLSDDFIKKSQENIVKKHGGRLMLIRASSEAFTDHRGEGEPYLRWLKPRELLAMARTGVGKGSDINHKPEMQTEGAILDGEYNDKLKQIQFLHYEKDPIVIKAIEDGIITAVSINGGPPREVKVECDGECFVVPKGVILGESDGIAFTYVVTGPTGLMWRGHYIPPARPGVKDTAIELL